MKWYHAATLGVAVTILIVMCANYQWYGKLAILVVAGIFSAWAYWIDLPVDSGSKEKP